MKSLPLLGLFVFLASSDLGAHEISYSFDSVLKNVKIEVQGDWVYIHLNTGATRGPRIVKSQIAPNNGILDKVVFEYQFVQDTPRSFRSIEPVTVTWKVMKIDWDSWNVKKLPFYFIEEQEVGLSQEDIDQIKSQW